LALVLTVPFVFAAPAGTDHVKERRLRVEMTEDAKVTVLVSGIKGGDRIAHLSVK